VKGKNEEEFKNKNEELFIYRMWYFSGSKKNVRSA
jgi:hypothetical protein